MSQISLTASMRSNLLSLQNTAELMSQTQERLATGKKVNSAIDNPSSYYTAQSLNNRANDLSSLLDSMGQAVSTIKAANEGITSITSFVEQAKAVAQSAADTTDVEARAKYAAQFDSLMDQIDSMANDSGYKGINLLKGENLTVKFSENNSSMEIEGVNATYSALGMDKISDNDAKIWTGEKTATELSGAETLATLDTAVGSGHTSVGQLFKVTADSNYYILSDNTGVAADSKLSDLIEAGKAHALTKVDAKYYDIEGGASEINDSIAQTVAAISKLRTDASTFGNNYSIVQTREEFTNNLINVLEEGADKLTLADMNEESANMLALQTRQQLAINSLSLASQAAQSVLQLFS
jgi:flagellin-like hook-associated protein FlgL